MIQRINVYEVIELYISAFLKDQEKKDKKLDIKFRSNSSSRNQIKLTYEEQANVLNIQVVHSKGEYLS